MSENALDIDVLSESQTRSQAAEGMPAEAYTALGVAIQRYEPEAMAHIVKSPAALLQVLLEAGRRALSAAAPIIVAAELQGIRALLDEHHENADCDIKWLSDVLAARAAGH